MIKSDIINYFNPGAVAIDNGNFLGFPFNFDQSEIILFPVPWDVTTSFGSGTALGPDNIRKASLQLDIGQEKGIPTWHRGIYFLETNLDWLTKSKELRKLSEEYIHALENNCAHLSNKFWKDKLDQINNSCDKMTNWVERTSNSLLKSNKKIGLIGGDHSVILGYLRALAKQTKNQEFGVLQIDAHMDLREDYEGFEQSHASVFHNVLKIPQITKLVQIGIRDYSNEELNFAKKHTPRIKTFYDFDLREAIIENKKFSSWCQEIISSLPQKIYISLDIDGLDIRYCPNTGTPVPGGLSFNEIIILFKHIKQSKKTVIGFDLCEVAGISHPWDGNVGARLAYYLMGLLSTH